MGPKGLFEGWHIVILIVVIVVVFGWKRLPDAARGLGRSMRIFKSEVDEMKKDGKSTPSAASGDTVRGETVHPTDREAGPTTPSAADRGADKGADKTTDAAADRAGDPAARETHSQPPV